MSTELELHSGPELPVQHTPVVNSLSILDAAIRGGINKDNVEVVERLIALRRDEVKEQSKQAFAKAFFQLRKSMPEIYADKVVKTAKGEIMFTVCSEEEISKKMEPHLFRHGFTMLFGQRQEDNKTVAIITLMHEEGHEETREYSVRSGATNSVKDATAADAGSTTTAWRHLMMKMFGLKSRIRAEDNDARLLGALITPEQADELERRVKETNSDVTKFLKLAGAPSFKTIMSAKYDVLDQLLRSKEQGR